MAHYKEYSPQELLALYNSGFKGSIYEPEHYAGFVASFKYDNIYAGGPLYETGKGKLSTPFKSVIKLSPVAPYKEKQVTGDCVSHSTRNAADGTRAVEIDISGEFESFITIGATEAIYGCRGHGGQGMSCSRAAEYVSRIGGVILRQKYDSVDLTKYQGMLGAGWGGRGVPAAVTEEAKKHQITTVTRISTVEQARDALANGYCISVCSNFGFTSVRDSKGFARPSGSWNHAMAWMACDDTGPNGPSFMIQNSWGAFNSGGHPDWGPIPDGAFLITADVAQRMLNQGGAFAFSSFNGFPPQKLPNYGTDYL